MITQPTLTYDMIYLCFILQNKRLQNNKTDLQFVKECKHYVFELTQKTRD